MMAITTNNSISVKPRRRRFIVVSPFLSAEVEDGMDHGPMADDRWLMVESQGPQEPMSDSRWPRRRQSPLILGHWLLAIGSSRLNTSRPRAPRPPGWSTGRARWGRR